MLSKKMKVLSLVMSIVVMIMSLPLFGYATLVDSADEIDSTAVTESQAEDAIEGAAYVIGEDVSKREESVKYFRMSDGSYTACVYNFPVHYEKYGEMVEIDNTVIPSDANDGYYEITDSPVEILLPNEYSEDTPVVYTSGEHSISFIFDAESSIKGNKKTAEENAEMKALKAANKERKKELKEAILTEYLSDEEYKEYFAKEKEEMKFSEKELKAAIKEFNELSMNVPNANSALSYDNIADNVSIEYIVQGTTLKENIVISDALDNYNFSFIVDANGLSLHINEDGSISAKEESEVVFTIPAPFMYDANSRYSEDVHFELVRLNDGTYKLTICADKQWINSSETEFPVIIDPIVDANQSASDEELQFIYYDTYVSSSSPDTNYESSLMNSIGVKPDNSINRIYMTWSDMPPMQSCDVITSAKLNMYCSMGLVRGQSYELYEVTGAWDPETITWNNQPTVGSVVLDYNGLSDDEIGEHMEWDITGFIKEWYETETTNGLMMKSSIETATGGYSFMGSIDRSNITTQPTIILTYRCQQGLEDDYTYTTYEDGQGGVAYINNFTGGLTYVKNLFTSESTVMPLSLDLVYNSSLGYEMFSGYNKQMHTCKYDWMYLSNGWKLSAQESIVPATMVENILSDTGGTYAYIYVDEDGTEHYFYEPVTEDSSENTETSESSEETTISEPVIYEDEDGLGMRLTYNETDNQYILEMPDGIKKTFKIKNESVWGSSYKNGYIISESDENGNTITYTYDTTYPTRLVSITDPSSTTVNLGYNANGYLTSVTIGARTITISYYTGWNNYTEGIKTVNDSYGNAVTFSYSDNTFSGYLAYVNNEDTSGIAFSYGNDSKVTCVSYRTGVGAGVNGARYSYDIGYATTIKYFGDDCTENSEDDLYITYTFNKAGNTALVYTENSDRNLVYNTSMYGYTSGNTLNLTSTDFNLSSYANTGFIGENLIADSGFEGNTLTMSTAGGATVSKVTSPAYSGTSAYRATIANESQNYGMSLTKQLAANSYVFSAYVRTDSEFDGKLKLSVKNSSGTEIAVSSGIDKTYAALNGGWMRLYVEFELTSADTVTLGIIGNGTGTFYADALQLEYNYGFVPSAYNMLENSSFENGLTSWSTMGAANNMTVVDSEKFGDKALKIASDRTGYHVYQRVDIGTIPQNSYIVSGWAKAESIPTDMDNRAFDLVATVNYIYLDANGGTLSNEVTTSIPFTWETREWQYVSGVVDMPYSTETETIVKITNIEIGVRYSYNCNTVYFDNVALVQDSALRINYDSNGNPSSIVVDNQSSYEYEYDDNDNLTKIIDEEGAQVSRFVYDTNNNLIEEYGKNNNDLIKKYSYDNDGNLIEVKDGDENVIESYTYTDGRLTASNAEGILSNYSYTAWGESSSQSISITVDNVLKTIASSATYDNTTKQLLSETDSFGNTTSYGYNADKFLTLIQDANGNQTRYTYSGNTVTSQYSDTDKDGTADTSEAVIGYTYDTYGKLTGISTATTDYVIAYNSANLPQSVSIAGETNPLITYLYNDKYTVNIGYTYANGLTVSCEYDTISNVKRLFKNSNLTTSYTYDAKFNVIKEEDLESGTVTEYFYTDGGTLYLTKKVCGDNVVLSYAVENEETEAYDYVTEINGTSLTYSSVYNETTEISKYVITDVAEITSDTDDFGRTEKVYLKDSDGSEILTCTYGYAEKTVSGELRTSEYISSMTYSGLNSNSYTYTYDANGNIISVSDGILTTSYVYDNLNQLVRENNQQFNRTTTYTYDNSGNILSKSQYAYTTGTLGTATDTVNYVYGNTNWGDQLTSYDGTTISYDAQGNPLNWGIKTLNWSGRTLLKYGVYEFTYDSNGLRTQKSMPVGGNNSYETNYIYDDDNCLIAETFLRGDGYETETYYYYGENGNPVAWRYNDTLYYYILNQQGDIMGFTDENGEEEVSYYYDAWGDILDYGGDPEIAEANSLLYRGYVYDWETELYYLQSRYYDPVVGRFLNADDTDYLGASGTTLGYNLYAYCENNVISYSDPYGYWVFGRGITYQLVMPVGGFVSVSYVWDTSGNCGVLISTGIGIGVFSLSISYNIIISWRNTIYDYVGYGMTIGGSYTIGPSIGLCIGGDITFDKRGPSGFSFSIGFGVALFKLEAHVYGTVTVLIPVKNHNYTRYYALKCLKRCIQLYLRKK